eukprot:g15947.t1
MYRFPAGFIATNGRLLKAVGHRQRRAWSVSARGGHGVKATRSFSPKKRPLGALRPETPRASSEPPHHYHHHHNPESDNGDVDDAVALATLRWVRSTVVGLNLCPWAGGALVGGRMQVIVHPPLHPSLAAGAAAAGTIDIENTVGDDRGQDYSGTCGDEGGHRGFEGLVEVAAREAAKLGGLEGEAAVNATTLVVARPPLVEDFDEFLRVMEAVDDFLDGSGLRGAVQLATFHPQYRFEGSDEDDASNYTNRSPYPVLHLLLEDQVSAAVSQVGDPEKVWQRNVETTRKLGVEAMRRGVEACFREEGAGKDQR